MKNRFNNKTRIFIVVLLAITYHASFCQEPAKYEFKRIEDNSFLIEEAYNQDPGVIQHISSVQYMNDHGWIYSFTDEWPLAGKKHQISASVPVMDAGSGAGIGDLVINYRYQAVLTDRFAFSPRVAVLFPTGNYHIETGSGVLGYQVSLPFSFLASGSFVTHYNLGATLTPDLKSKDGTRVNLVTLNYGISVIWLLSANFNFMLEVTGNSYLKTPASNRTEVTHSLFLNPGFRTAINFKSGLQIVPGLAIPVGIGPSSGNYGMYVYLSFEHILWKEKGTTSK